MSLRTSQSQVQKTILAPSMQQSIEVLLLPLLELNTAIDQELQENPLLEIDEEKTAIEKRQIEQIINHHIKSSPENLPQAGEQRDHTNDDDIVEDRPITRKKCLEDFLLEQLQLEFSDPQDLKIGEEIIGNLNESGFLTVSCEDIANKLSLENAECVEAILKKIQYFDPIGIASRNLKECLIKQAEFRYNGHFTLIEKAITNHLEDFGRKKYQIIAKGLQISMDEVKKVGKLIAQLEPKPARKYRPIESNLYVKPDVTIYKDSDDQYHILVNSENIPHLRINAFYRSMLNKPNRTPEEMEFIKEKIKGAIHFIRSIEQRYQTIRRISEYILKHQKDFFEHGHLALQPMILKDVAQAIERNESTVCRAISNKYIDTPQGLVAMKYFFSQGLKSSENKSGTIATQSIKAEIQSMIDQEDPSKPLSDQDLQDYFKNKGLKVARRTISKYRQSLNILPYHLRKE